MAQSIEKLSKRWVLQMTPNVIHFIVKQPSVSTNMSMFGQIMQDRIFEEYRIESAVRNNIWLELAGEHFVRALKSCQQAADVTMKLTKRDGWPTLSLNITNTSKAGKRMFLVQDIPVRVLPAREAEDLTQPILHDQQVHIILPPLSELRTIAERMRSLANHVTISANMNGEFLLKIHTDTVRVETSFKGLVNPDLNPATVDLSQQQSLSRPRSLFANVRVDIRDFNKFLHSSVINPKYVVCCIIEDRGLVLYVYLGDTTDEADGSFVYYVPMRMQ